MMNAGRWGWCAVVLAACASPGAPPGGPEDHVPPQLIATTPDSGAVNAKTKEVIFAFNEVVSESPQGAPDLSKLVLVSPSDGDPNVSWNRNSISVKLRHGWRDSTTYVVTLLPGIADIAGNPRDTATVLVFSTGGDIPKTRIAGAAFDWIRNKPAPRASIEAWPAGDTTVKYVAETDSVGRFVLPFIKPGTYMLRGLIDTDRNRIINPRELWDTTQVVLRDSVAVELYMYPHDSAAGPIMSTVTLVDSTLIRVVFDKPLTNRPGYLPSFEVRDRDSVLVPTARIVPWSVISEEIDRRTIAERDSIANADTSSEKRTARERARRDSINRAAIIADSLAKIPNRVEPPKSSRPALVTEYGIQMQRPLAAGTTYVLYATAIGMGGIEKSTQRPINVPKAAAKDTTNAGAGAARGRGGVPSRTTFGRR